MGERRQWILAGLMGLAVWAAEVGGAAAQDFYYQGRRVFSARRYRHTGFYAHAGGGFGGFGMRTRSGGFRYTVRGPATHWSFAVGGSVAPGLAVHASYFGAAAWSPVVREDGVDISNDDPSDLVSLHGLGGGLTAYTPANFYLSGSVGAGFLQTSSTLQGVVVNSQPGLTLQARAGKEWWVGRQLGLGVAAQLLYFRILDAETGDSAEALWHGLTGGVLLSATFN